MFNRVLNTSLRSSCSQMFFKIGVLISFRNFTGKHLCWSLFLGLKACNFIRDPITDFFTEHFQWLLLASAIKQFIIIIINEPQGDNKFYLSFCSESQDKREKINKHGKYFRTNKNSLFIPY